MDRPGGSGWPAGRPSAIRPLPFGRGPLYVPLALLHASLVLRLAGGDWAGNTGAWQWGGSLNEIAVLLFLILAATAVIQGRRTAPRQAPPRPVRHAPV